MKMINDKASTYYYINKFDQKFKTKHNVNENNKYYQL